MALSSEVNARLIAIGVFQQEKEISFNCNVKLLLCGRTVDVHTTIANVVADT